LQNVYILSELSADHVSRPSRSTIAFTRHPAGNTASKAGAIQMTQSARARSPLTRRSSGAMVADFLRRQIISGELAPGQRLTQEDIAEELGTSRVPVREALVILEQEGFVKMEMHRGGFVLPIETSISDNAEVWEMVFGLVARRAAARLTPEFDAQLAQIAGELTATRDPETVSALCEEYLDVLFDGANAPPVARAVRRTRAGVINTLFDVVPDAIEISRKGALAIIDAIRGGDSERANAAHAAMQRKCLHLLMKVIERRDG
jgi:DNA-binding GntR family transcriptional regulator